MVDRLRGIPAVLLLLLSFASTPAVSADEAADTALIRSFVAAFNSGEFDTVMAFYRNHASEAFNGRRTDEESRALHDQLVGMLGQLTVESIGERDGKLQLLAASSVAEGTADLRFSLVGDPLLIDTFSVGVRPPDGGGHGGDHGGASDVAATPAPTGEITDGPFAFLASAEDVFQTQVFAQADGSLLLVWVQRGLYSLDLFAARLGEDRASSHPIRLNRGAVNRYVGDEARPGVAVSPDGGVAVVWTADDHDIILAVGSSYGLEFDPPVKLNQDDAEALRTMPTVAFGPEGSPHAIWLDARDAPAGMEEPSNLYYATLRDGAVVEENLTERQLTSVCGCCRPFIQVDEQGQCDIAFRNVSDTGFRDIWRIGGRLGALGDPEPTSPPIWKLGGCPSAGPIVSQGGTLWKDASTGDWRLLWATDPAEQPESLFTGNEERSFTAPPRTVSGKPSWVLVGARPATLLATLGEDGWTVLRDDLPAWATSAAVHDGELVLVGNVRGKLQTASYRL